MYFLGVPAYCSELLVLVFQAALGEEEESLGPLSGFKIELVCAMTLLCPVDLTENINILNRFPYDSYTFA